MISNAVGTERAAKIVGYEVKKGNFQESTPNLPMSVAIFGQANTAKQSGLTNAAVQIYSEKEAGDLFGYGSQIHSMVRILRGKLVDRMGGIPTIVYPQLAPAAGDAEIQEITVTGAGTGSSTHIVRVNGRSNFDGKSLEISIVSGDTPTTVAAKIADAISNANSCPISATSALGVVECTTKWVGENAGELDIEIDVQSKAVGLSYAVAETQAAAGDSSAEIVTSLALFGNTWHTIVLSPYPASRDALFEAVNGVPDNDGSTGKYSGEIFKPFVVLRGDTQSDTVSNITSALDKDNATIAQCPAPNSKGWDAEAAANICTLLARQAQDNPHLDVSGKFYPDMPVPLDGSLGVYDVYNTRDAIVQAGGSTVILINGKYRVEDFITSYHPDNENPPQFRYVRSLIQDWNIRFGYFLLEGINVVDHAIAGNDVVVTVSKVIKPKQWRAILRRYFNDLAKRVIIVESEFSIESLEVGTNDTNPDRLETYFKYKRSPFARISSTTAEAGFAFGIQ